MATTAKNRITRTERASSVFPDATQAIDATISYNQGDLLFFDDSANLLKPIAAEADAETFCGIAVNTVVLGVPKSPYSGTAVDAAQGKVAMTGPVYGVIAKLISNTGQPWNTGDLAYASAVDAQHVGPTGTKAIGVYVGPDVAAASEGQEVEIRLGHRFPGDTLVMG